MPECETQALIADLEQAEWRKVLGWPYEVSEFGAVRHISGRLRKHDFNGTGYHRIDLFLNKNKRRMATHRLVYETFVAPLDGSLTINHKDGNKLNNHYSNLEQITRGDNIRHGVLLGLAPFGSRNGAHTRPDKRPHGETHGHAKLKTEDVYKIFQLRAEGETYESIAGRFGVDQSLIGKIMSGSVWGQVGAALRARQASGEASAE